MESILHDFVKLRVKMINHLKQLASEESVILLQDEEGTDEKEELPRLNIKGRHGDFAEYGISKVSVEDNVLWFQGVGVNEQEGQMYMFGVSEIDSDTLVEIVQKTL